MVLPLQGSFEVAPPYSYIPSAPSLAPLLWTFLLGTVDLSLFRFSDLFGET